MYYLHTLNDKEQHIYSSQGLICTHAKRSITIFPLVKQTWGKKSLKYNGAVFWNNILQLGINPDISDFMFSKKLKHAIIESLL